MTAGLLLPAAAGLKLYGFRAGPISPQGFFATAHVQLALVEFEFFLALWLLWGKQPIGAWGLALLISFCTFAGVSFYQGVLGQASCGCLGKVVVNPWVAFGVDLAVVAGLLVGQPDLEPLRARPWAILGRFLVLAGAGLASLGAVALLLFGLAHFRFGSVDSAPSSHAQPVHFVEAILT